MATRGLTTTGVALVAALSIALTGCDDGTTATGGGAPAPSRAATTTAPADAREALLAGARKLNEDSVRVTMDSVAIKGEGIMDPRRNVADLKMVMLLEETHMINIRDDVYLRSDAESWWHVDKSALPAGSPLDVMPDGDPAGINKLVNSVAEVRSTGDRAFAGTLDYTRTMAADADIRAMGDKARAVPFTAKVDEQGRLVEFVLDLSAASPLAGELTTRYHDFGVPVTVQAPPAAQVEEIPAAVLESLGG